MRENLKRAREEKGLTQQQLADHLGINIRHYQKIESGEIRGTFDIWNALEDRFGVHQCVLRKISDKI